MEVNGLNFVHTSLEVGLRVQHLVCGDVGYLDVVGQQPEEDGLHINQ